VKAFSLVSVFTAVRVVGDPSLSRGAGKSPLVVAEAGGRFIATRVRVEWK
jgi:hypothetical protein